MSYEIKPSACLVFFGLRYLSGGEIDEATDPRAKAAEGHDLCVWWGRRYPPTAAGELPFFLLVGDLVCRVGYDGSCEDAAELPELQELVESTTARLLQAGFTDPPELWVQCKFD